MSAPRSGTATTPDGRTISWEQQELPLGVVRLHVDVWRRAAYAGIDREHESRSNGRTHRHRKALTDPARRWDDLLGAVAECAVAQALNVYWPGARSPGYDGDLVAPVVGAVEVRSTERTDGRLIVYQDEPDRPFVLVAGFGWDAGYATVRVAGWILGADAQASRYWKEDAWQPAYFVPQSELLPLESLKRWTEGKGS